MSAPDTDVEKQEKKHKAPLGGMAFVVIFAVVLLVGLVFFLSAGGDEPEGSEIVVDGRTGAEEPAADGAEVPATE